MSRKISLIIIFGLLLTSVAVWADRVETEKRSIDAEGADEVDVNLDFAAGSLYLKASDMAPVADVKIEYNPRWVDYDIDYHKSGSTGKLFLKSELIRNHIDEDIENDWELQLSDRYPMDLDMDIGACDADIDFGGLRLKNVKMDVGAADSRIDFSRPNPERMRELDIETGASSLKIEGLGNANFDRMTFESGAASCKLDFHGDFSGYSKVSLEIGIGSCDIIIPRDIAVRIETDDDSWFSSVDFHGMRLDEVDDGVYESDNYDTADNRIAFDVQVGMSSVDFYFKR